MAVSTSFSFLLSPRTQLLSSSSLSSHRLVLTFLPSILPRKSKRLLSYQPRCCLLSAAIPQRFLQTEDLKEELICAISEEMSSIEKGGSAESLHEALKLVDLIQRLGIQRFFKLQIDRILKTAYIDYCRAFAYFSTGERSSARYVGTSRWPKKEVIQEKKICRQWDDESGLNHANVTVLGYRLLRLEGYYVYGDVLRTLKDNDDGNSSTFSMTPSDRISGLLNLYKCSQVGFPQESEIMGEAQDFSSTELIQLLSNVNSFHLLDSKQREEIKFSLAFPRLCLLSRMEARSITRQLWPSSGLRRKCLELACIDLEALQKLYQQEMYELERWLDEQWLEEFPFPRNRLPKLFIGVAMTMFEPQFSFYRATVTKISCLVAAMDDLFDSPTSDYQGLCRLQEAFQSWDTSPVENLPRHKAIFKSYQQNLTDIASVASTAQGRDVLPYIKEVWQDLVSMFTIEAEWRISSQVPSLEDYLPVAVTSVTAIACLSTFILILGEPITDETLRFIGKDSRFLYLASLISRLANDIATNESEEAEGKLCNAVGCYMEDHPECTKEDAIMAIKEMIKASFREMEQVMFMCRGTVPECCIRAVLGWVQAICISYRKLDGYKSTMDTEYEELVKDYMGY